MAKLTRWERFKDARTVHNQHGKQTMDEVAIATGVSKSMIQSLEDEKADRSVGYDKVAKLASHYHVSADYLLGLSDDPSRNPSAVDELGLSEKSVYGMKQWRDTRSGCVLSDLISFIGADVASIFDAEMYLSQAFFAKDRADSAEQSLMAPIVFDPSSDSWVASPHTISDFLFDSAEKCIHHLVSVYFDAISGRVKYKNFPQEFYDCEESLCNEDADRERECGNGNNKKN